MTVTTQLRFKPGDMVVLAIAITQIQLLHEKEEAMVLIKGPLEPGVRYPVDIGQHAGTIGQTKLPGDYLIEYSNGEGGVVNDYQLIKKGDTLTDFTIPAPPRSKETPSFNLADHAEKLGYTEIAKFLRAGKK